MAYNYEISGQADILRFISGGNATFTVENATTGNRFTFKVVAPKGGKDDLKVRFVKVMTGSDNERSYSYIGFIPNGEKFIWTAKSSIPSDDLRVKAFAWLFTTLKSGKALPENVHFMHAGKCARCGRTLTVPSSILSGIGPECAGKVAF